MFKKLLSVGGFTLLSRITGFARDILMAWTLGHGFLSDAFIVAFLFPNYFRAVFGEGTINPAFLPRYAALHARGEKAEAAAFANQIFSWQMAAQALLLVLALVAMPQIVRFLTPGWTADQIAMTAELARISFPYLILTLVAVQLSAMLNAIQKFWAAAAWSNFLNLSIIACLLAVDHFPNAAYAAAWGVLAAGLLQLAFMLWASAREGIGLKIVMPRWTPQVKEFFIAFAAVTFGAASVVVAPLVDTWLASYLAQGSRTALYYADRINQLPLGVLGIALGTVLLPEMASLLAKGKRSESDAAQNRSAVMVLLLTLPFAAVFIAIPGTIMRAFFAYGAFSIEAADLTAVALAAYGIGLPAMAMVRIVASTFHARHDTMTPARATVIAIVCNILLKIALVWSAGMGLVGLALGTSLGAWINVALLTWYGHSRDLLAIEKAFVRALPPVLLAAAVTGVGAWLGAAYGTQVMPGRYADLFGLFGAMLCGGTGFVAVVAVFRGRLPLGRLAR
jgi:putative peptidoglycan lipid II flippase